MASLLVAVFAYLRAFFLPRHQLALKTVALRQQLAVFKRKQPRPKLWRKDRLFWVALCHFWSGWAEALIFVKPETVVPGIGPASASSGVGVLAFARATQNQGRNQTLDPTDENGESDVGRSPHSRRTAQTGMGDFSAHVSRYLRPLKRHGNSDKAKRWLAFLHNHREVIAALDFFTVPTLTFRVLYCFFVIEHGQRRILRFHTSAHPTSDWVVQQLREAFPFPSPYRYVILDRDAKFSQEVLEFLQSSGIEPIRTSIRSPWQNGVAGRWVGSCRRELLDHVIPLNESHLRRLGREYLAYYHEDRTHKGLAKETPVPRPIQFRPGEQSEVGGGAENRRSASSLYLVRSRLTVR